MKLKIQFRTIPSYFKALTNSQRIDQLDNEQYFRSFGFSILDDKALKKLKHMAYKLTSDEPTDSDKCSDVDHVEDMF